MMQDRLKLLLIFSSTCSADVPVERLYAHAIIESKFGVASSARSDTQHAADVAPCISVEWTFSPLLERIVSKASRTCCPSRVNASFKQCTLSVSIVCLGSLQACQILHEKTLQAWMPSPCLFWQKTPLHPTVWPFARSSSLGSLLLSYMSRI